jgi:hypothetical protein
VKNRLKTIEEFAAWGAEQTEGATGVSLFIVSDGELSESGSPCRLSGPESQISERNLSESSGFSESHEIIKKTESQQRVTSRLHKGVENRVMSDEFTRKKWGLHDFTDITPLKSVMSKNCDPINIDSNGFTSHFTHFTPLQGEPPNV